MHKNQSFFKSVSHAIKGISEGSSGRNFKRMLVIAIVVIGCGFYFHLNRFEWALIWISISMVLCLELMNTAIEILLDHLHPEHHEKVGKVKDIAAGAVLLACLFSAISGIYIFITHWLY